MHLADLDEEAVRSKARCSVAAVFRSYSCEEPTVAMGRQVSRFSISDKSRPCYEHETESVAL